MEKEKFDQLTWWLQCTKENTRTWTGNVSFCKNKFVLERIAIYTPPEAFASRRGFGREPFVITAPKSESVEDGLKVAANELYNPYLALSCSPTVSLPHNQSLPQPL